MNALAILLAALSVRVGSAVPDFSAVALDGTRVSLSEATRAHRTVVVLFLSTVCPYANSHAGRIAEMERGYRDKGVIFVAVNSNHFETLEETREMAREHGYGFPVVKDEGARLADLLGASRTPEAFVVGADGRLRYHGWVQSKVRSPDLQRALDEVLAGKAVRLAETKPFGCAIDRSH